MGITKTGAKSKINLRRSARSFLKFSDNKPIQIKSNSNPHTIKMNIDSALKIIPEFKGNRENLHKFIACCDVVFKSVEKTEEGKFLDIVQVKLCGLAYDIVKNSEFKTWSDLKSKLNSQFGDSRSIDQIQLELVKIKQTNSENIRTYALRVQTLISELNDACIASEGKAAAKAIQNLNSKIGLRAFQEGIYNSSIKLLVKACLYNQINEAIEKACEEESQISSNHPKINTTDRSKIKCQICHKIGHCSSDCYQRYKPPNFSSSSNTFNQSNRNPIACAYCKNMGHHISECRKRQFNNSKNSQVSQTTLSNLNNKAENRKELDQSISNTPVRVREIQK